MTSLNFHPCFVNDIESGRICRTIRRVRRAGNLQPGSHLQFFIGLRTSQCKFIREAICTRVRPVEIDRFGITLDGRRLHHGNGVDYFPIPNPENFSEDFAREDGFDCFSAMVDFFEKQYGLPFKGQLIEWRIDNDKS